MALCFSKFFSLLQQILWIIYKLQYLLHYSGSRNGWCIVLCYIYIYIYDPFSCVVWKQIGADDCSPELIKTSGTILETKTDLLTRAWMKCGIQTLAICCFSMYILYADSCSYLYFLLAYMICISVYKRVFCLFLGEVYFLSFPLTVSLFN